MNTPWGISRAQELLESVRERQKLTTNLETTDTAASLP